MRKLPMIAVAGLVVAMTAGPARAQSSSSFEAFIASTAALTVRVLADLVHPHVRDTVAVPDPAAKVLVDLGGAAVVIGDLAGSGA